MKNILNIKSIFILLAIIFLPGSCDFLDYSEQSFLEADDIFSVQTRAKAALSNIYSYLQDDFSSVDGALRSSASDDAEDVYDILDVQKFNDGSWNPIVTLDDVWGAMYTGIREANWFIQDGTGQTFPYLQYNQGYDQMMQEFRLYTYEARFLRAFFYFELIKRYGDVPLITTVLTSGEANKVGKAAFENVVEFIVTECESAAANLPVNYDPYVNQESGRATKGAAMALKARTLLYAASALHNDANDIAKWVRAATASKELIDQVGDNYSPLPDYTSVVNDLSSKEKIFEKRQASDRDFEIANTAIGFIGGNTGTCPTQNLVDAYEMKATGLGISQGGSGYDPANPYEGRDPRFYMTILYNGATWKSQTIETWHGGKNAQPSKNATKTGYYLKKYMIESVSLDPVNPTTANHYWIIFRYAEVLLNYAEAMNEAYGPEGTGPAPLGMTALNAVNTVRARTGVDMPAFPAGLSQSDFRDKLRNERRVELAFEDHRFWDIRRWKIGPSTTAIKGFDLLKDSETDVITYTLKSVENRIWDDKMYLYPISETERFKNGNLVQNPGW